MRKADNQSSSCAVVTKSGNLNFLEPSEPIRACKGTALPLPLPTPQKVVFVSSTRNKEKWDGQGMWHVAEEILAYQRGLCSMEQQQQNNNKYNNKATWTEGIRGQMGEKGLTEEDWKDRDKWKEKIR